MKTDWFIARNVHWQSTITLIPVEHSCTMIDRRESGCRTMKTSRYGTGDEDTVITEYLDAHLEGGIQQKNLDKVLDLIDEYVELEEAVERSRNGRLD